MKDFIERRFAKDPSIVSRKIVDEYILVPIRQKAGDLESIFTLNETAARIWELIDGKKGISEIRDVIVDEFEVNPDKAEEDLVELLKKLDKVGALKVM